MLCSREFHKDFASFTVSPEEIGLLGLSLQLALSAEALSSLILEEKKDIFAWRAEAKSLVSFSLRQEMTSSFVLNLAGNFRLSSSCCKCLDPVEYEFSINHKMRLLPKVDQSLKDEFLAFGSNALSEELDDSLSYFEPKCIDLGIILREQIFLTVPDYPCCGDEHAVVKEKCAPPTVMSAAEKSAKSNPFVKWLENKKL